MKAVSPRNRSKRRTSLGLEDAQFLAIRFSVQLGKILQESLPLIAEEFRGGKTLKQIVENHNITELNNVSEGTAINSIRYALRGYHADIGFLDEPNYGGMMGLEEYENLAYQHISESTRRLNIENRTEGKGIYNISDDQRKINGLKGAYILMKQKRGIHAQDHKKNKENGRLGAKKCGFTIWSDEEKFSALDLATKPESGISISKIVQELNRKYHNGRDVRSQKSVERFLWDYQKGLRQ